MQHDEGFRHWAQSLLFRKCDRQPGSGMLRAQAFETKSKQLRAEVHYQRGRLAHARGPAWRVDKKVKGNVHCIARLEGSVGIFVLMHRMVLHHHVQKTYQKQHVPPSGSPNELGKSIVVPKWTLTRTLCGGWHPRCPKPMTIPTAKSSCQRRTLRFRGEVMSCRGMAPISREIQCLTQAWKIWPKTVEDRDALDQ